jgi:hypothetical protein
LCGVRAKGGAGRGGWGVDGVSEAEGYCWWAVSFCGGGIRRELMEVQVDEAGSKGQAPDLLANFER